jgi:Ser/Thr protein kinase RdoA (MazF antagonist)
MLVEDGWTCETFVDGNQIGTKMIPKIKTGIARFHKASSAIEQRPGFKSSVELLHLAKGGDVNLNVMPRNLVSKCREAWNMASKRQQGIIHGDLNGTNVLKTTDGRFALVDWDECRRDLLLFDTGQIEHDDGTGQKARLAWEIACSWVAEPERARALASDL